MTTPEMIRCKGCSWLEITRDGQWVCNTGSDEGYIDIHDIPDEECPVEGGW